MQWRRSKGKVEVANKVQAQALLRLIYPSFSVQRSRSLIRQYELLVSSWHAKIPIRGRLGEASGDRALYLQSKVFAKELDGRR